MEQRGDPVSFKSGDSTLNKENKPLYIVSNVLCDQFLKHPAYAEHILYPPLPRVPGERPVTDSPAAVQSSMERILSFFMRIPNVNERDGGIVGLLSQRGIVADTVALRKRRRSARAEVFRVRKRMTEQKRQSDETERDDSARLSQALKNLATVDRTLSYIEKFDGLVLDPSLGYHTRFTHPLSGTSASVQSTEKEITLMEKLKKREEETKNAYETLMEGFLKKMFAGYDSEE